MSTSNVKRADKPWHRGWSAKREAMGGSHQRKMSGAAHTVSFLLEMIIDESNDEWASCERFFTRKPWHPALDVFLNDISHSCCWRGGAANRFKDPALQLCEIMSDQPLPIVVIFKAHSWVTWLRTLICARTLPWIRGSRAVSTLVHPKTIVPSARTRPFRPTTYHAT